MPTRLQPREAGERTFDLARLKLSVEQAQPHAGAVGKVERELLQPRHIGDLPGRGIDAAPCRLPLRRNRRRKGQHQRGDKRPHFIMRAAACSVALP